MQELLAVFGALSDETRLRILKLLEGSELCVCEIVATLGLVQPKVSFHLSALKGVGLVRDRRQGRWTFYSIEASDLFKRFLILSVLERVEGGILKKDKARLDEFHQIRDVVSLCKEAH